MTHYHPSHFPLQEIVDHTAPWDDMEDVAAASASEMSVYSEVKLSSKERGYDESFEEIKRSLTTR